MTEIYSMSFDQDSSYLGLTSVRGTLHIFELAKPQSAAPTDTKPTMYAAANAQFPRREPDSEDELPNNYKRDNKSELREEENEEETKEGEAGCCGGWLGLKYVLNKVGGIIVDDPEEAFTAGITSFLLRLSVAKSVVKYNGENIKRPNILALDKDRKVILFCKDGSYYEYKFDPQKNEAIESSTSNIADLKATCE
ncbi:MAG: hypothetical protein P4M11_03720 [Candidatus Pacebacteria bacterium]|nr:hypothetical protein [Candidatus Paceibacterota bacterium]